MTTAKENDEARFGIINSRFFGSNTSAPGEIVYSAGLSAMHPTIRQGLMEAIKRFDDFGDNVDHDRGELDYHPVGFVKGFLRTAGLLSRWLVRIEGNCWMPVKPAEPGGEPPIGQAATPPHPHTRARRNPGQR